MRTSIVVFAIARTVVLHLVLAYCANATVIKSAPSPSPSPFSAVSIVAAQQDVASKSSLAEEVEKGRYQRAVWAESSTPTEGGKSESVTKVVSNGVELELKNITSDNPLPSSLLNKIVSILASRNRRPTSQSPSHNSVEPNKQLFGGRLPPFVERIIQRIQNYFSVYNPPEYFEGNRPPQTQNEGITIICSNSASTPANESLSCNAAAAFEEQQQEEEQQEGETLELCDNAAVASNSEDTSAAAASSQDEYNVVVTHTVVQDSSLNVYSPTTSDSTQMVSNVVVILEPAAGQYSSPPLDNPDKNKFYVYVNPTSAANKKNEMLKTTEDGASPSPSPIGLAASPDERVEKFQPFVNTTYTVIIRGDKLQEYNNNLQNVDNDSLNPEVAVYIRNSTGAGSFKKKKCKLPSRRPEAVVETDDCEQNAPLASRSVTTVMSDDHDNENNHQADTKSSAMDFVKDKNNGQNNNNNNNSANKVPNINLMLVPPNEQNHKSKNKPCPSKNKTIKNPNLEYSYYVLKPDVMGGGAGGGGGAAAGNAVKSAAKEKPTYYLQKANIEGEGVLSQTYLPPPHSESQKQAQLDIMQNDNESVSTPTSNLFFAEHNG